MCIASIAITFADVAVPAAENIVLYDFSTGIVRQDVESSGLGADPAGYFISSGLLFKNGLLLRLGISTTEDEGLGALNSEAARDTIDQLRVSLTAGYLFNRDGIARPFLYGGLASLRAKEKLKSLVSGDSVKAVDDHTTVITLGAGIEVGQTGNHNLLVDLGVDQEYELDSSIFGEIDFDLTELKLGYLYRF